MLETILGNLGIRREAQEKSQT